MKLLVHTSEVWVCNVRIDLSGRDIAVPEHGLDAAQVCAVHEQVCREAMAQGMRTDMLGDARQ